MELVGKKLGRYQIQKALGTGAQATVYLAIDTGPIKRQCALKVAHKDLSGGMSTTYLNYRIIRFVREAAIAGQFTHPNIVTVYEYGQDKGIHFIAMEYVQGFALSTLIKQIKDAKRHQSSESKKKRPSGKTITKGNEVPGEDDTPSLGQLIEIVIQACEALHAIHSRGIIHRDIKPGNIMWVSETKSIKITDFGISKVVNPELRTLLGDIMQDPLAKIPTSMTMQGDIIGTPMYMSPEQMVGNHQKLDHRSDIYSMGAVLFQLLTGKSPLEMDLNAIDPSIPSSLIKILQKSVAKDPDDRFSSGRAFADALRETMQPAARWGKGGMPDKFKVVLWTVPVAAFLIGGSIIAVKTEFLQKVTGKSSNSEIHYVNPSPQPLSRTQTNSNLPPTQPVVDQKPIPSSLPPSEPADKPDKETKVAQASNKGILKIVSSLDGNLKIDGENHGWIQGGKRQDIELTPGTHKVVLSNSDLDLSESQIVEIVAGKTANFSVNRALQGNLQILCNASGLDIYINGNKKGRTQAGKNILFPLSAGNYSIRLSKQEYNIDDKFSVQIRHQKTETVEKSYMGQFDISTNIDVSVKLDGQQIHKTPTRKFSLKASPGRHTIELVNPIDLPQPHTEELVFMANETRSKMIILSGR